MGKSMGGFLWQLERKRKYYMSFGSSLLGNSVRMRSRTTSTVATTAVTFSLCLLVYLNLWSSSTSSNSSSSISQAPGGNPSNSNNINKAGSLTSRGMDPDVNVNLPVVASVGDNPREREGDEEEAEKGVKKQKLEFKGEAYLVNSHGSRNSWKQRNGNFHNFVAPSIILSSSLPTILADSNSNNLEKLDHSLLQEDNNNGGENESRETRLTKKPSNTNESNLDRLKRIFRRADVNHDSKLSFAEISKWINDGVKEHFSTALKQNFDAFFGIDKDPRNGRVEWSEYLKFHMHKLGYKGDPVTPEVVRSKEKFKLLPKHIKVEIAALEARWSETAANDPDFLTVDEFLAFTHPEASPTRLLASVQDTFNTFDLDGDGTISKTEFDTTYAEAEGVDNVYREDLKLIDVDGNGQISRVELMRYMDPKNTIHSDKDARKLMEQVDADGDEHLSWDELTNKLQLVLPTKLFDVANNFHANQLHN